MNKPLQHWTIFVLLFLGTLSTWAETIDVDKARQIAEDFLYRKTSRTQQQQDLTLTYASNTTYVFESPSDFAVVAADNSLPEILGYGTKSGKILPPALKAYLKVSKYYTRQPEREHFKAVEALLPFVRHQYAPYNNRCPKYVTPDGKVTEDRCVVGCVATALEEIISYYRRDLVLQDTLHGWESKQHTAIEDILPGTQVDCRLIRNDYDTETYTPEEEDAVARLSYYCGVAAKMKWGINESGASITNLIDPLKKAFGYKYVQYVDSYKYSPQVWLEMVRKELYSHRPVLYTAFNMRMAGHAFVIDGLDEKGLFHVNWGYGGSYDGYFRLDVLNYCEPPRHETPEGKEDGFFTNHQALFLHPDSIPIQLPDTLTRTGYEIQIDSVKLDFMAETHKETPLTIYIRNTTDQYLTTPFEFFTNSPKDTAILEQGDFIALGTSQLAPYEARAMNIYATFDQAGERILRISPDDKAILYEQPITIMKGKAPQLTFSEPAITFPKPDVAFITETIVNGQEAGRCGQEVIYELSSIEDTMMKDGIRHPHHLSILPGESVNDTIRFHSLLPGHTYTLLVRSPWKVQTQKTFVVPEISGITSPSTSPTGKSVLWYRLDGRPIDRPQGKGIYLRREGNQVKKYFINK